MNKLVNLTLTDDDCLDVRMALNATAIYWGEKATAARNADSAIEADTCERIRSGYHRLWEAVNVAQELAERERTADDMLARDTPRPRPFNAITRDIRAQNGLAD